VYTPADGYTASTSDITPDSETSSDSLPDGGITQTRTNQYSSHRCDADLSDDELLDVTTKTIKSIETVHPSDGTDVYDLTVSGTHNFVANGMIVHNSEDRSAMHEALEQQSYHPQGTDE